MEPFAGGSFHAKAYSKGNAAWYMSDSFLCTKGIHDLVASFVRLCIALCPACCCSFPRRCRCIVRSCKRIPLCIEFLTLCWSYYTYVYIMCFHLLADRHLCKWADLLGFHVTFLLCMWPFHKMLRTPLKPIPVSFYVMQRPAGHEGTRRYCQHCHVMKPDRCHHCSICGVCVLKMDHHCPWFNTCVSFANYKFFVLFLFYSGIHCAYLSATTLPNFGLDVRREIGFWPDINITFLFLLSLFFALAFVLLLSFHLYLVCRNRTTLELMAVKGALQYDLGIRKNITQVFGVRKRLWFVPVYTSLGDGAAFPTAQESYQAIGSRV